MHFKHQSYYQNAVQTDYIGFHNVRSKPLMATPWSRKLGRRITENGIADRCELNIVVLLEPNMLQLLLVLLPLVTMPELGRPNRRGLIINCTVRRTGEPAVGAD
jgi:hypothetical protein